MLTTVFATKLGMTQAWTKAGKRLAVTRCKVAANMVVGTQPSPDQSFKILEIGYGTKKLKNLSKPLRSNLEKSGFSLGFSQIRGIRVASGENETIPAVGQHLDLKQVLQVGDVVKVQGVSKGRGFAGAVKRYGFAGGPKTHGQSDRHRAVGSIGAGTTPGRVFKGKRMPGHYGVDNKTVAGLTVIHIDPTTQEVWLSGPVPGHNQSILQIDKTGKTRQIEIQGLEPAPAEVVAEEVTPEVVEEVAAAEAEVKA